MRPKLMLGTYSIITLDLSASNEKLPPLIFLRVGMMLDATRCYRTSFGKRVDLLTLVQIRDNVAARTLTFATYTDTTNMTVQNCVNFCNNKHYIFSGVEYGQECCEYPSNLTHGSHLYSTDH